MMRPRRASACSAGEFLRAPGVDLPPPLRQRRAVRRRGVALPGGDQRPQRLARHRRPPARPPRTFLLMLDGSMSTWIFFEPGLNAFEPPGHPVVEPRADIEHHVAAMHGQVGLVRAVHAQHAEELRVAGRDRRRAPSACWCRESRSAARIRRSNALACRPGIDHPAAGIDDRPLARPSAAPPPARCAPAPARSAGGSCGAARRSAAL